jgi:hypothetical protein
MVNLILTTKFGAAVPALPFLAFVLGLYILSRERTAVFQLEGAPLVDRSPHLIGVE